MSGRRSNAFRNWKLARFMPVLRVGNREFRGVIAKENDTRLYKIGPIQPRTYPRLVRLQLSNRFSDVSGLRQDRILELRRISYKRVQRADALHGRVEILEELIADARGNLGSVTKRQ